MAKIILKAGREEAVKRRHPWIFSGAVAAVEGAPQAGQTVQVCASDGALLAHAAYSPRSQIRGRVWSFSADTPVDSALIGRRIDAALEARRRLGMTPPNDAFRLVHAEADGLPGLVVDSYGPYLVCQFLSAGAEYWRREIVALLAEKIGCSGIFERSDAPVRQLEGLALRKGPLWGSQPPARIKIRQDPFLFWVDVKNGQKTGFFLDQRINRLRCAAWSDRRSVLNCFAYTGAFAVAALKGGAAHVVNLEASAGATELARLNCGLNGLPESRWENVLGNAFDLMRTYVGQGRRFDMVVLDPPKFAGSRGQLPAALRAYKEINLQAFRLLNAEGCLVTFSCSGVLGRDLFQKVVAEAALDAGRKAQILEHLQQGPDHPIDLHFPESAYLKGLVCRVV